MPYWTAWLVEGKDLTVQAASTVVAVGLFVRSFSTFFIFPSLSNKFSVGFLMKLLAVASSVLLLLFLPFESYYSLIVAMVIFSLVYPMMMPMTESVGAIMTQNENIHYGKSRSWGSIGYTVALLAVGGITASFGESSIVYIMFAGCLMMVAAAFYYTPPSLRTVSKESNASVRSLLRSPRFVIALIICVLIQGAHASYYNYGFLYLQELGVGNSWSGLILNVAILSEIIFFAVADRLFKHTSIPAMFLIATVASIVRWSILFLFPTVYAYIFSQLFHSLTFGLAHFAFIRLLYEEFNSREIPAAQGMYASLGMGLSTSLLTFLGGYLYNFSPGWSFFGMAIAVLPAIWLSLYMGRKFKY